MKYEVIDLDTDESHGVYETLGEARGCVRFDLLRAYSIWSGRYEDGEFVATIRVGCCEPYDGDGDRAAQGEGEWIDRTDGASLGDIPAA